MVTDLQGSCARPPQESVLCMDRSYSMAECWRRTSGARCLVCRSRYHSTADHNRKKSRKMAKEKSSKCSQRRFSLEAERAIMMDHPELEGVARVIYVGPQSVFLSSKTFGFGISFNKWRSGPPVRLDDLVSFAAKFHNQVLLFSV